VLIKIGGSIITSPGAFPVNEKAIAHLGHEFKNFKGKAIIIHGTGYVGKPPAIKHGYLKTKLLPKAKMKTALKIRNQIDELSTILTGIFNNLGIPVVQMDNIHFFGLSAKWNGQHLIDKIDQLTRIGIMPLFAGNFLPLASGSQRIFSSDELTLALARLVRPDKVMFLTDVDGVLDSNGNLIQYFSRPMLNRINCSPKDVSGGMKEKASIALKVVRYCDECIIANGTKKSVLKKFLRSGTTRGTKVLKTG
jgi:isopentenyl phosphate kinase